MTVGGSGGQALQSLLRHLSGVVGRHGANKPAGHRSGAAEHGIYHRQRRREEGRRGRSSSFRGQRIWLADQAAAATGGGRFVGHSTGWVDLVVDPSAATPVGVDPVVMAALLPLPHFVSLIATMTRWRRCLRPRPVYCDDDWRR